MTYKDLLTQYGWGFSHTVQPSTAVFAVYTHSSLDGEISIYNGGQDTYWDHTPIVFPDGVDEDDFTYDDGDDEIGLRQHLVKMDKHGLNPRDYEEL